MTAFITVHNIPFSISSHLSKLVDQKCPDSVIAKDILCSHLCAKLKINNFSILVHEASVGRKHLCVVFRTVDSDSKVHEDFFSVLLNWDSATDDVLFDVVQK
ncbi:hypothetical protein PR048_029763 [Dryococelus australis]|uniref:Uncharacterized protein n=1 Tax=Dryococelus australis TaxID=614101 RepID=A0ABQ9G800_9NEOP|nr:hypothetical protein PR048_029763 [Dryococelus australis]